MHRLHHGEDNCPVCSPCGSTVHVSGFFHCHGNVLHITAVKHNVHRHIENCVEDNNAHHIVKSEVCSLLYKGHHKDSKWYEHTAYNVEIYHLKTLFAVHISSDSIACHGVDNKGKNDSCGCDDNAVSEGMPEVGYTHCLCKIIKAEALRKAQCAINIVCHFRGGFESDNDSHIQREQYRNAAQHKQYCQHNI